MESFVMFLYALMTALLACNLPAAAAVSVGYEESINPPPVPPQPLDLLESVLYSASETAPDVPVSRRSDYTGEDRSVIIGEHNRHRRQVTPTAANMNVLKWDAELAAMAQGWSDQCFFEHGNPENTSPFGYVGQNLYIRYYSKAGQPAPSAAVPIQKWYDEASQYKYADRSCSGVCGHYTQLVWATTTHVGCGQTYCETALDNNGKTYNNAWLITCNYGPGGNYKGQFPYQEGEKCSKCDSPGTCKGGLCKLNFNREVGHTYTACSGSNMLHYMMQKISGILNSNDGIKPYNPPIKVVLATRSDQIVYKKDGVDKEMMYLALCDSTGYIKATLYEPSKIEKFANGSTIMIRNYLVRNDKTMAITSHSQIFRSSHLEVPESILNQAISSVRPPTPQRVPIKEVHTSPVKTLTSVGGVIAQDEVPKQVNVRGEQVPVRTIVLKDRESKVKIALWRKDSAAPVQSGDFISVQNVVVQSYKGENQLSTTSRTVIKKTEPPTETLTKEVVAYNEEENSIQLLLADDETVTINVNILKTMLNTDEDDWQAVLSTLLPFTAQMTVKDNEAITCVIQNVTNLDSDSE